MFYYNNVSEAVLLYVKLTKKCPKMGFHRVNTNYLSTSNQLPTNSYHGRT